MSESWRSGWRAFLGRYLISLVVATALVVSGVAIVNRGINERVQKIPRINLSLASSPPDGANYLIIGSDTRKFAGESGNIDGFGDPAADPDLQGQRSDTLMVAHVEPNAQRTFVVSFPRDLWVNIPGHDGMYKINAAYEFGGPQLVVDTLALNFDIPIQHYLEVDFKTFQSIVDAIGNVKVSFPYPARDQQTGLNAIVAGCYPLDGAAALAYVRSRYLEYYIDGQWQYVGQDAPDLHRIERQQAFIRKLAGLAIEKSLGDPLVAIDISNSVLEYLKADTQLSRDNVNELIRAFRTVNVNDQNALRFETVPVVASTADDGQSILTLGPGADAVFAELRTFGDNTAQPPTVVPGQVTVKVSDGSGKGLATAVADTLGEQGFHASPVKATSPVVPTSEIHYAPDQIDEAKALLAYVPDAKFVSDGSATGAVRLVLGSSFPGSITVPPTTTTLPGTPATTTTTVPSTTTTTIPAADDCS
jgi:polyisoprenyl-teichoic acid--peptidoglycan teichoic acid transferase